ncbi:MAG: transposase [Hyphomonadaceae bacterium]|nr:transposase [Hyphomonadaceae bacterium]
MLAALVAKGFNEAMGRRGWHQRGYLPHLDGHGIVQHVVFRLHDSVPPNAEHSGDDVLDRGFGSAVLSDPALAEVVARTLLHHDGERYVLHAWCVMPNHVHVLMTTSEDHELGAIVRSWKAYSARQINEACERQGRLWAADYFDRYMRDDPHFWTSKAYIENNPVAAGLCSRADEWRFSSAGWRGE